MSSRLILWNLRTTIRWWWILATIALFALIALFNVSRLNSFTATQNVTPSIWDGLFLSFSGPPVASSMLDGLAWLTPQLLLYYFIGDIVRGELLQRGECVLPRIGSRLIWWSARLSGLTISVVSFFATGFLVVFTVSALAWPWSLSWSRLIVSKEFIPSLGEHDVFSIILLMFLLLVAAGLSTVFFQTVLALYLNSINAYIAISGLTILAWFNGSTFKSLVFMLPANQSILSRHSLFAIGVEGFSISWSLLYSLLIIAVSFVTGAWALEKTDIVYRDI